MLKVLLSLGLFLTTISNNYVCVNSIEYYQSNSEIKEFIFNFESDYFSSHEIVVSLDFYQDDKLIRGYSSSLKLIGEKQAKAKLSLNNTQDSYVLISVYYNNTSIIENARLNMYVQSDCFMNISNNYCNKIYKSEYKNGLTNDLLLDFKSNNNNYNKYLVSNKLNLEELTFYSNYDFRYSNIHLIIKDEITGYEVLYNEGYNFLLDVNYNNGYHFTLMDYYYVNLLEFKYTEKYQDDGIKTSNLYFPYIEEYKEYSAVIIIEDFITINIEFNFATNGLLLGECSSSKYCLVRENND
jgi:hypothetical protein